MHSVTKISLFGIRLAVVVLTVYWMCIFAGTHLPTTLDMSPDLNDKVKHFSAYFGLATLLCYVTNSSRLVYRFGTIGLLAMAYGVIDEVTQNFVPGRVADPWDFLADSVGIWTAIGIYVGVKVLKTQSGTPWFLR